MNIVATEDEKKIFNFLKSQNCCLRCCFRFIGYRTWECYSKPVEFAAKSGYSDIRDETSTEEAPCISCLGVLQDVAQEDIIAEIAEKVKEKDFDCSTFTCALTVPVSMKLREHVLYAYMSKEIDIPESNLSTFRTRLQSVKDIWKLFMIPEVEEATEKRADLATPSPFLLEIFLMYTDDEVIFKELMKKKESNDKQKKRKCNNIFSRKDVDTLLGEMTDEQLLRHFPISQIAPKTFVHVYDVVCSHTSIFIGGRYNKLSRKLSQTPWFIGTSGRKRVETSVQDLLCNPIAETLKAESIKFLSSGREDVDVRNIYDGRPFAVELLNPRMTDITSELLTRLTFIINQSTNQVRITSDLKVLLRSDLKKLKEGENVKTKFYRALCICRGASSKLPQLEQLNELKNVKIIQKTPVRVLHRRPLTPRTRFIYEMRARWAKPHELDALMQTATESKDAFFVLDIKSQAGTYVKEFVHGDFGRTKPSLCDLLKTDVDIVALDVTGINLKWP